MRISDWSSDVCSSDLDIQFLELAHQEARQMRGRADPSGTKIEVAGFLLDLFGQLVDVFDFKMLWSHDQHIGQIGYLGHCNQIGQWVVSKLGQRGVDSDRADRFDDKDRKSTRLNYSH